MSSVFSSTIPRAFRTLRPQLAQQYRCLYAPAQLDRPSAATTTSAKFSKQRRVSLFNHYCPTNHHPITVCEGILTDELTQQTFHASSPLLAIRNPYTVLGIDKNASAADIKKAYYFAAKKYHPDSSKEPNAREKFQDVQSAYEILSDPEKKQQFDQFGEAGFDPSGQGSNPGAGGPFAGFGGAGGFSGFGGGPFSAEFSFEDLYNAATGGGARKGRKSPFATEVLVGEDVEVKATISFMDAAKGVAKDIRFKALTTCATCNGSGMKRGTSKKSCGRCGGTGTRVHFIRGGFQMAATCESCAGQGVFTPPGSECGVCSGHGVTTEARTISVDIPAGVEDGMRMRVTGEGDAPPSGSASADADRPPKTKRGDLFVHITVEPHTRFGRKGSDILYTSTVPVTTALLGGVVRVPTLDGDVDLRVPTGTSTGDSIVMPGMGMKKIGARRRSTGDLRVEFKVNIPKYINPTHSFPSPANRITGP